MKIVVKVTAISVLLLSLVFLFCWHFHVNSLLQCSLSDWPMPYSAAFCIFLSGLSLFSLFSKVQLPFTKILGGFIFFFGMQRVVGFLLPTESSINLLFSRLSLLGAESSQMALSAAIGFVLLGFIFIIWAKKWHHPIKDIIMLLLAVVVVFLGSMSLFINLFSLHVNEKIHELIMHLYTSICLVMIGTGIVFARFNKLKELMNLSAK